MTLRLRLFVCVVFGLTVAHATGQKYYLVQQTINSGGGGGNVSTSEVFTVIGQVTIGTDSSSGLQTGSGFVQQFNGFKEYFASTYAVHDGWNLLSVPRVVNDYRAITLYPTAISRAFEYQGTYLVKDTLVFGHGFWIKFDAENLVPIVGVDRLQDSTSIVIGWNLIGCISTPLAVANITSNPGGIVTSQFFGYNGSYQVADTLFPGQGYWVRTNQDGTLIFDTTGSVNARDRIVIRPTHETPPSAPGDNIEYSGHRIPDVYALKQNYPNPFNPSTVITYQLPGAVHVSLKVFDILGREVASLVDGMKEVGNYSLEWNPEALPSGLYYYRLVAGTFSETKKMLIVR